MNMVTIISSAIHEEALREAGRQDQQIAVKWMDLNTPLSDDVLSWANRIWDQVDSAIRKAWSLGYEASHDFIAAACKLYDEAAADLKDLIEQVSAFIVERLDDYVRRVVNGAVRRFQSEIVIGERKLRIATITVEQKLKMSSSLEFSLHQICKFAADGELTVGARYEGFSE